GDGALLATISPNGDGFRDAARIRFTLLSAARVEFDVARTKPRPRVVYRRSLEFSAGGHAVVWAPSSSIPARTYVVRLRVLAPGAGASGARAVVRVQGVDAAFARAGYRPGATARLTVSTDASSLELQIFHVGGEAVTTHRNDRLEGSAVTPRVQLTAHRADRARTFTVAVGGDWASGVYYAQLTADDGRASATRRSSWLDARWASTAPPSSSRPTPGRRTTSTTTTATAGATRGMRAGVHTRRGSAART
ncbi:MAG: hypothetical protein ABI990_12260, partial [Actinomycetota bacterium]